MIEYFLLAGALAYGLHAMFRMYINHRDYERGIAALNKFDRRCEDIYRAHNQSNNKHNG